MRRPKKGGIRYFVSHSIGNSLSGPAKLDPQLAIYLPFLKWSPTSRTLTEKYPSLRDYAQPSILHGPLEHEDGKGGTQQTLPIIVHQLWVFVTGPSKGT